MIQVNVKKNASISHDDVDNVSSPASKEEDTNLKDAIPMVAASIESWGGLQMRCSEAGSLVRAADFG